MHLKGDEFWGMFKYGDCYMSLSSENKPALRLRRAIAALCMAGAALQTSHALAADAATDTGAITPSTK